MTAPRALEFGLALSAGSFTLLASTANLLTAVLALVGNLFYVVVYTGYLKRRGPQNIVLGGAAGAVPPLVGYAAATGQRRRPRAVAVRDRLPVDAAALLGARASAAASTTSAPRSRCFRWCAARRSTLRRIVGYTVVLVAATVVPVATGTFGPLYLAAALVLGGLFLGMAVALQRRPTKKRAATLFHYSLLYLALLFVAAALDPLL